MISYEEFCNKVFSTDPNIRFVGILDGERTVYKKRPGLYSLLTPSENIRSATHTLMRWQSRRAFVRKFGIPLYSMAEYPLIKRVTMQLEGNVLLLVSMDKKAPHEKIIKKLLKLKEKYCKTDQDSSTSQ